MGAPSVLLWERLRGVLSPFVKRAHIGCTILRPGKEAANDRHNRTHKHMMSTREMASTKDREQHFLSPEVVSRRWQSRSCYGRIWKECNGLTRFGSCEAAFCVMADTGSRAKGHLPSCLSFKRTPSRETIVFCLISSHELTKHTSSHHLKKTHITMVSCIPRIIPYLFLFFGLLAISVASPILAPRSLGTIERRTEGCPAEVNTCKDHCDSIGQGGGSCEGPFLHKCYCNA